MDISKELPNPLPEGWSTLEQATRFLAKQYPLDAVHACVKMLWRERADTKVVEVLKGLLEKFEALRRVHVFYDSGEDGVSYFRIFLDIVPGREGEVAELKTVEGAWIKENLVSTGDRLDFIDIWEKFDLHAGHYGANVVVIERTSI